MAKVYLKKLSQLVDALALKNEIEYPMETKHIFNGAALYVDGTICVSWSPVGLAFKLPETEASALITEGRALPLRYFPKGYIKRGYALFDDPQVEDIEQWRAYFTTATRLATVDESGAQV